MNREIRELGQKNGNVGKQSPKSPTLNVMSAWVHDGENADNSNDNEK